MAFALKAISKPAERFRGEGARGTAVRRGRASILTRRRGAAVGPVNPPEPQRRGDANQWAL